MKTKHTIDNNQTNTKIPNHLAKENSPYLLQHAYNPVNWYPWGKEAFDKAEKENKPIFLSIGYSTCHWCHVMAHESFEDEEVASYLNQHFISIKVDKEERPDIDSIYMSVCQNITGSGGWPLSLFLMPDQKPFFAGTYYPKYSRYQMPGFLELLKAIKQAWEQDQEQIQNASQSITQTLQQKTDQIANAKPLHKNLIAQAATTLLRQFDTNYGGFSNAPKFPTPHNLMFLLRYAILEQKDEALKAVEKTLDSMYKGGIFDHIGYGFSRYSTDEKWLVPHFEKMLYDNALLLHAYLEVYQVTGKTHYKQIAEMTLQYVQRELMHPEGGFYCAQDADSEGEEGKYYVFQPSEIEEVLGKEDGAFFNAYYDITPNGNFEGSNIPNRIKAGSLPSENPKEEERIAPLREKVYHYRLQRTKLHKDDKILTSWNALMIAACAKAYKILKNETYLTMAIQADNFLRNHLSRSDQRLFVHYRNEKASGIGHIDDYVFYSFALLELYEATLEPSYLERSFLLTQKLIELFFDKKEGGFYLYAKDSESLIARPKEVYDGAIPSGNSVATYVMEKLYHITKNELFRTTLDQQLSFLSGEVSSYPSAYCFSMMAFMQELYTNQELVLVLPDQFSLDEIRSMLASQFTPQVSFLIQTPQSKKELASILSSEIDYPLIDDKPTYYLCENFTCHAPVHDLEQIKSGLQTKHN